MTARQVQRQLRMIDTPEQLPDEERSHPTAVPVAAMKRSKWNTASASASRPGDCSAAARRAAWAAPAPVAAGGAA